MAAVLILAVVVAAGGYAYVRVKGLEMSVVAAFHSAQGHLERGKALLKQANQKHDAKPIQQARSEFQAGIDDFRAARALVDGDRLAQFAGGAPLIGSIARPQLDAVDHLADMGISLSRAAIRGGDVDQLFLAPPQGQTQSGTVRLLALVHSAQPALSEVRAYLERASRSAASIDPSLLPHAQQSTFTSVKGTITKGLSGLDELDRLLPVMDEVLGVNGPRTYLIEQVNPFELRAGGGYMGTYSLLSAANGELKVIASGDTHDLADFGLSRGESGYVAPPPTMTEFLNAKSWSLGDSNFFPDFQSNAKAALSFAQQDFSRKVDGVIALDLYAVQALLRLTGPIQALGSGAKLGADNLFQTMIQLDIQDPTHKEVLSGLAGPLMGRITGLGAERWPQLLDVLNQMATQRHIQVYFANAQSETEIGRLGWSGGLAWDGQKDFFFPVESNFGGNKMNYFLTRQYTVVLSRAGNMLHHRVQIDLSLDLGKAPPLYTQKWSYRAYFRLFVPADAANERVSNVKVDDSPYTDVPPGTKVIDGWQELNPSGSGRRGSMQIVYEYDTPWDSSAAHPTIYWQKQPGTGSDKVTINWNDGSKPSSVNVSLNTDLVITLGTGTVTVQPGHAAAAQFPKLSF